MNDSNSYNVHRETKKIWVAQDDGTWLRVRVPRDSVAYYKKELNPPLTPEEEALVKSDRNRVGKFFAIGALVVIGIAFL